jgi:SM-20-related protein
MEAVEYLEGQCVVLDEFLAPEELNEVMRYALEHEADYEISEVISPGVGGSVVDYEHRKSRVLVDLGKHREVIGNRIRACLPRVLQRLGRDPFTVSQLEAQITASNHGDFFGRHSDNDQEAIASRELTFVYFFHREPKAFGGGNLKVYHTRRENGEYVSTGNYQNIVPEQNQMVLFLSSLLHEITPVECPSEAFADSRFTVNGWLHR